MRISLLVSKCQSMLKTVNAKAQFMLGMSYNIGIIMGSWFMKTNVLAIHLKDFDLKKVDWILF